MLARRWWIQFGCVGTVGVLLLGGAGYYSRAQNVFRRSPVVEILPPPPEVDEAIVELLPPSEQPLLDSSQELEPIGKDDDSEPTASLGPPESSGIPHVDPTDLHPIAENLPMMLSVTVPSRIQAGTGATFHVKLINSGERSLAETEIACEFSGSLAFPGSAIRHIKRPLSHLKPNDSREVMLTLVGSEPGWGLCRFILSAKGVEPIEQQFQIEVIPRRWELNLIGPAMRAAGQRAEFMLRLSNPSNEELQGLKIGMTSSAILKPTTPDDSAQPSRSEKIWNPADLAPGQSLMLPFEFLCADASEQACVSVWVAADSVPEEKVDACLAIVPPHDQVGVEFADVTDPIRRGDEIVYEARIENRSLHSLHDVGFFLESTSHVAFAAIESEWEPAYLMLPPVAWRVQGQQIQCDRLPEFPANARLKLVVKARGVEPGDARLRMDVSAKELSSPPTFTEYTTIASPAP